MDAFGRRRSETENSDSDPYLTMESNKSTVESNGWIYWIEQKIILLFESCTVEEISSPLMATSSSSSSTPFLPIHSKAKRYLVLLCLIVCVLSYIGQSEIIQRLQTGQQPYQKPCFIIWCTQSMLMVLLGAPALVERIRDRMDQLRREQGRVPLIGSQTGQSPMSQQHENVRQRQSSSQLGQTSNISSVPLSSLPPSWSAEKQRQAIMTAWQRILLLVVRILEIRKHRRSTSSPFWQHEFAEHSLRQRLLAEQSHRRRLQEQQESFENDEFVEASPFTARRMFQTTIQWFLMRTPTSALALLVVLSLIYAVPSYLLYLSFALSSVSECTAIWGTVIFFAYVSSVAAGEARLTGRRAIAVLFGCVGVYIIALSASPIVIETLKEKPKVLHSVSVATPISTPHSVTISNTNSSVFVSSLIPNSVTIPVPSATLTASATMESLSSETEFVSSSLHTNTTPVTVSPESFKKHEQALNVARSALMAVENVLEQVENADQLARKDETLKESVPPTESEPIETAKFTAPNITLDNTLENALNTLEQIKDQIEQLKEMKLQKRDVSDKNDTLPNEESVADSTYWINFYTASLLSLHKRTLGNTLALLGAALMGLYETLSMRYLPVSQAPWTNAVAFAGLIGMATFIALWPPIILLHLSGYETFEVPSLQILFWLLLNGLLNVSYTMADLVGVAITTPVFSSGVAMLMLPTTALLDYFVHGRQSNVLLLIGLIVVFIAYAMFASGSQKRSTSNSRR